MNIHTHDINAIASVLAMSLGESGTAMLLDDLVGADNDPRFNDVEARNGHSLFLALRNECDERGWSYGPDRVALESLGTDLLARIRKLCGSAAHAVAWMTDEEDECDLRMTQSDVSDALRRDADDLLALIDDDRDKTCKPLQAVRKGDRLVGFDDELVEGVSIYGGERGRYYVVRFQSGNTWTVEPHVHSVMVM